MSFWEFIKAGLEAIREASGLTRDVIREKGIKDASKPLKLTREILGAVRDNDPGRVNDLLPQLLNVPTKPVNPDRPTH